MSHIPLLPKNVAVILGSRERLLFEEPSLMFYLRAVQQLSRWGPGSMPGCEIAAWRSHDHGLDTGHRSGLGDVRCVAGKEDGTHGLGDLFAGNVKQV